MSVTREAEALNFLNSAVQNLAHYVDSHCPRAERQARMALERLEGFAADPDLDAVCEAIENMLDGIRRS